MKNLKLGIVVCGALGLVGMFMIGIGAMLEGDKVNTLLMLGAFGVPVLLGIMGIAKPPFAAWQAAVSLAGFALAAVKLRIWETLKAIGDAPTEYKLMLIGTVVGVIVAVLALVKPESNA